MNGRFITQDKFFNKELKTNGNCMQCCIASYFGLPLNEVPNFMDYEHFWGKVENFFNMKGFEFVMLGPEYQFDSMYLASGPASRGVNHIVLMQEGKLLHDPHPSREGLLKVENIYFGVPFDPKKVNTYTDLEYQYKDQTIYGKLNTSFKE